MTNVKEACSVSEFCEAFGLCHATFYNLLKTGRGPKIMKVGRRTLISEVAKQEWCRCMEQQSQISYGGSNV